MSQFVDGESFKALEADVDANDMSVVAQAAANGRAGMSLTSLTRVASVQDTIPRPPIGTWINAKQVQESAIITAVRRQIEALEDKLNGHFTRELMRVQQHGDRMRDAAIARVDAKISSMEANQPKFDRRLAELSGNYKGLSEEVQAQIRRIDQMDSRLWEWRHQLDEDMRAKLSEIEQNYQQICTSVRVTKATNDDVVKRFTARVVRLEELADERATHAEDLSQSLMNLHARLMQVEEPSTGRPNSRELSTLEPITDVSDCTYTSLALMEKQHSDALQKVELLQSESGDLRSKVESQEERYRSLRTLCDARDEQIRSLGDRMERGNWEGRIKELQTRLHEVERGNMGHEERLEVLQKKVDCHEQVHGTPLSPVRKAAEGPVPTSDTREIAKAVETEFCIGRLSQVEERVESFSGELDSIRTDLELAPRVAALVAALKDVAPKVIVHEAAVRKLQKQMAEVAHSRTDGREPAGEEEPESMEATAKQ